MFTEFPDVFSPDFCVIFSAEISSQMLHMEKCSSGSKLNILKIYCRSLWYLTPQSFCCSVLLHTFYVCVKLLLMLYNSTENEMDSSSIRMVLGIIWQIISWNNQANPGTTVWYVTGFTTIFIFSQGIWLSVSKKISLLQSSLGSLWCFGRI